MEPFRPIEATLVPLAMENVDTDQIIPARFLKVTDKSSLGEACFCDWRTDPNFVLNDPRYKNADILLAGHNFGCGSSREHAPWALKAYGFKAVISTYFADIFKNNALKNGLLPIVVDEATHKALFETVEADPHAAIYVDLATRTVILPDGKKVEFPIDDFSQQCLLDGVDELGYLLQRVELIEGYEAEHPTRVSTAQG